MKFHYRAWKVSLTIFFIVYSRPRIRSTFLLSSVVSYYLDTAGELESIFYTQIKDSWIHFGSLHSTRLLMNGYIMKLYLPRYRKSCRLKLAKRRIYVNWHAVYTNWATEYAYYTFYFDLLGICVHRSKRTFSVQMQIATDINFFIRFNSPFYILTLSNGSDLEKFGHFQVAILTPTLVCFIHFSSIRQVHVTF